LTCPDRDRRGRRWYVLAAIATAAMRAVDLSWQRSRPPMRAGDSRPGGEPGPGHEPCQGWTPSKQPPRTARRPDPLPLRRRAVACAPPVPASPAELASALRRRRTVERKLRPGV